MATLGLDARLAARDASTPDSRSTASRSDARGSTCVSRASTMASRRPLSEAEAEEDDVLQEAPAPFSR